MTPDHCQHLQKVATARHLTILDTKTRLGTRLCQVSCKTQIANFGHSATFRTAECQGNLVHPLAQTFGNMWKVKLWNTTKMYQNVSKCHLQRCQNRNLRQSEKMHTPKMAHLQAGLLEVQRLVVPVHICSSCFVQDRLSPSESDSTSLYQMSIFTIAKPSKLMHHST